MLQQPVIPIDGIGQVIAKTHDMHGAATVIGGDPLFHGQAFPS